MSHVELHPDTTSTLQDEQHRRNERDDEAFLDYMWWITELVVASEDSKKKKSRSPLLHRSSSSRIFNLHGTTPCPAIPDPRHRTTNQRIDTKNQQCGSIGHVHRWHWEINKPSQHVCLAKSRGLSAPNLFQGKQRKPSERLTNRKTANPCLFTTSKSVGGFPKFVWRRTVWRGSVTLVSDIPKYAVGVADASDLVSVFFLWWRFACDEVGSAERLKTHISRMTR